MQCHIYKGRKKQDHYLYLPKEGDFSKIPASLLQLLGPLEEVMILELTPDMRLARANPAEVLRTIAEQGFYLQLPPNRQDAAGTLH